MKTRRFAGVLFATAASLGLLLAATDASAFASGRFAHPNAAGGVTAGKFRAGQGPNSGAYARGRALATDGAGNGAFASGRAFRGPNGGRGARIGGTTWGADGSVNHASGFRASGARGSVQSSGSATRSADGDVHQNRTTTATSSATGNTRTTTESYSKDAGLSRSTTCTDAAGNAITCPTR